MEVTFELTQKMIENELLSIYYNTFSFRGYNILSIKTKQ